VQNHVYPGLPFAYKWKILPESGKDRYYRGSVSWICVSSSGVWFPYWCSPNYSSPAKRGLVLVALTLIKLRLVGRTGLFQLLYQRRKAQPGSQTSARGQKGQGRVVNSPSRIMCHEEEKGP
jgi:hypothetical protein